MLLVAGLAILGPCPIRAAAAPPWPTLSSGANGANVVTAQFLLRHHGQTLSVDGAYGASTRSAVIAFQAARGLAADGEVGRATWTALAVQVRPGANGQRVAPGRVIGRVGSTGNSSGPHLHIEVRINGGNRCPQPMVLALYDGTTVPAPQSLPAAGCSYASAPRAVPDRIRADR